MTARTCPGFLTAFGLVVTLTASAAVINDGSSTSRLVQLSNTDTAAPAVATLQAQSDGTLLASQVGLSDNFVLQNVWFATSAFPTGGVYTVSADFLPAQATFERVGGVMGWLNLASSNGIALQIVPEDTGIPKSFQVVVIDFTANDANDLLSVNHLFETNGNPAVANLGSAWTDIGTNYTSTNLATFQIDFSAPSAADLAAVTNATAHVKALVFQGVDGSGNPIPVCTAIELITDLPLPQSTDHRVGYFAAWDSIFPSSDPNQDIGYLDNLAASGQIGVPPDVPPTISITSPTNIAAFTEPADITIVANASDVDGTVTRVDFFQGITLLGSVTNSPYSLTWSNVSAGAYTLTAVAMDDRSGASTSAPVNITVTQSSGTGPQMTVVQNANSLQISWGVTGYQLQMKTNLLSSVWFDIPNTVNATSATVPISAGNQYFRLVGPGQPVGPTLSIQISGSTVVVSWPASVTGYRLQAAISLSNPVWTDVSSTGNQATENITGPIKFYRLINP